MEAQYVKELSMELLRDGEGERPMQEPWNTFQNNFLRAIRDHQWDWAPLYFSNNGDQEKRNISRFHILICKHNT